MTGAPDSEPPGLARLTSAEAADLSTYVEIHADGWRFQPRVAAVCVWQGHVLLQGALDGAFWVLPGGRLLPLELTASALVRTMRWEIGQEVTVQRLLWVMEYVTPMGVQPVHELGFYYATDLPDNSPFFDLGRDHAGVERGHDLVLRWFPVDALPDVALFPEFLRTAMQQIPDSPQHIVRADITARSEG
jgi:ADP-ribose pyrophosphatase YjhB (NUDIX family)